MTTPAVPRPGYRLLLVCVAQSEYLYLVGGPSMGGVQAGKVPPGVGTRFASFADIEQWVRRELRGISTYWQVRVIDEAATVVRLGFRTGDNGTGQTWTWRQPTPNDTTCQPT